MRRYLTLGLVQLKAAVLLSLQYRLDLVIETLMALFWCATALLPLLVLFSMRDTVAGFSAYQALAVTGFFMTLKGVMVGAIQPSLVNVVEHVRKGTLDFLLLKPVDAQFMLSTSKLELPRVADVLGGLGLSAFCIYRSGARPSTPEVAAALLILLCAVAILYGLWIMVVSLSFRVVKIDNLSHLILSVFDAARFPVGVFRGALAVVFTFVIPLGLMTTYPALALMGRLTWVDVLV
ncbi:MAG TPA: ABC-2 family transporter protein, partial [Polyangiales bacterium]